MKNKVVYNSIYDIKIAKERLRYEVKLYEEKLKNTNNLLLSGISVSFRNLKFNIRNRLVSFALFRSLYKSNVAFGFIRNFVRGFMRSR
jgi:hypothetical protein